MADKSNIEWTEATWNPVTGCSKISAGCKNCYAERLSYRLKAMGNRRYRNGFKVTLQKDALHLPKTWKMPKLIFVNSMSDLFHQDIPTTYIKKVFSVMNSCSHHTFQVLTKRSERLLQISKELDWSTNIWMGVSVEDENVLSRIDDLRKTQCHIKFLSCEPLIGPLNDINLTHIDWVIVGGESGPKSRLMKKEWVETIQAECKKQNVPFFFKQWGGTRKDITGRTLNGKTYDEMPVHYKQAA